MGKIDMEVLKRVCGKKFRTDEGHEAETGVVALCSSWQKKLKDLEWDPFHNVKDDKGYIKVSIKCLKLSKQHFCIHVCLPHNVKLVVRFVPCCREW